MNKQRRKITKTRKPPPPLQTNPKQSLGGSIVDGIATGITFGTGSALGHRAMDAIFGPRKIDVDNKPINNNDNCVKLIDSFNNCLNKNNWEIEKCDDLKNLIKSFNCEISN
jgi:hypothetical protein